MRENGKILYMTERSIAFKDAQKQVGELIRDSQSFEGKVFYTLLKLGNPLEVRKLQTLLKPGDDISQVLAETFFSEIQPIELEFNRKVTPELIEQLFEVIHKAHYHMIPEQPQSEDDIKERGKVPSHQRVQNAVLLQEATKEKIITALEQAKEFP